MSGSVALSGIRGQDLSAAEVTMAVARPGAGGTAVFVGTVRDTAGPAGPDGAVPTVPGRVVGLDYSAHPDAAAVLARVAAEVAAGCPDGVVLAVLHRTGSLDVGEPAIVAAASAPHRAAAFTACHALVDEVKARVPIWKRERGADGRTGWVGMPAARTGPAGSDPVADPRPGGPGDLG